MRISDWSSDVCSSDLLGGGPDLAPIARDAHRRARRLRRAMGQHRHVIAGGYDILAAEQFFHIAGVRRVCRGASAEGILHALLIPAPSARPPAGFKARLGHVRPPLGAPPPSANHAVPPLPWESGEHPAGTQ